MSIQLKKQEYKTVIRLLSDKGIPSNLHPILKHDIVGNETQTFTDENKALGDVNTEITKLRDTSSLEKLRKNIKFADRTKLDAEFIELHISNTRVETIVEVLTDLNKLISQARDIYTPIFEKAVEEQNIINARLAEYGKTIPKELQKYIKINYPILPVTVELDKVPSTEYLEQFFHNKRITKDNNGSEAVMYYNGYYVRAFAWVETFDTIQRWLELYEGLEFFK